jgi:hypothetical protein
MRGKLEREVGERSWREKLEREVGQRSWREKLERESGESRGGHGTAAR